MTKKQRRPTPDISAALQATAAAVEQRASDRTIADLRSKLARSEQKRKLIEGELAESEMRASFVAATESIRAADIPFVQSKPTGAATGVLSFGDWHCEENVDPATINGKNEFNLDICAKRIATTVDRGCELLDAQRGMSKISDGVVSLIGDMITGHIHEDLSESNWLSPVEASLFAQDQIAGALEYLRRHSGFKSIIVATNFGNHGRITKKPRSATAAQQSYEWLMYQQLARHYRNDPKIKWKVERGVNNYVDVQGKVLRLTHGDKIKYNGGSGGIVIPAAKAIAGWDRTIRADYTLMGHFHTHEVHPYFTLCGCLIGFNAYALEIKADCSDPSQTLLIFDKKRQKPVLVQEIWCD